MPALSVSRDRLMRQTKRQLAERVERLHSRVVELERLTAQYEQSGKRIAGERDRLVQASESCSEGVLVFDGDERLVYCNGKFRELYPLVSDRLVPGAPLEELLRHAADRGLIVDAIGRTEAWVAERRAELETANQRLEQEMCEREGVQRALRETTVDLAQAAESCVILVLDRARESGVRISRQVPEDLPALWADQRMVKQILLNLLANAVKFTPDGGDVSLESKVDVGTRVTVRFPSQRVGGADSVAAKSPE